jgi:predicted secreted Zn-dependent protease
MNQSLTKYLERRKQKPLNNFIWQDLAASLFHQNTLKREKRWDFEIEAALQLNSKQPKPENQDLKKAKREDRRTAEQIKKKKKKKVYFDAFSNLWTSDGVGRAGIAPFLVVVIAPHAFANLSTSLNFCSSCK